VELVPALVTTAGTALVDKTIADPAGTVRQAAQLGCNLSLSCVGGEIDFPTGTVPTGGGDAAGPGLSYPLGGLTKAGEYGVWPYRTLIADLKGTGLQAHHLLNQRFARVLGQVQGSMASIAVTDAEHQGFTNAWRTAIPYGPSGTGNATPASIEMAARRIYAGYPELLVALGFH
jgi:hypothetical protein